MKRIKRTVLFAAALLALTSCLKPVVSVNADFITDLERLGLTYKISRK